MINKYLKKLLFILMLTAGVLLCGITGVSAGESKKAVYIVYDDTAGIYYDGEDEFTDKWSQLKNAVQTFASLTNTGDKIVIYPLSAQGNRTEIINNSNMNEMNERIDKALNGYAINRKFTVVTKAYEDLKKESTSYEKWLLVICDGKFEEYKDAGADSSVQGQLVSYASNGIKVISHAVSNDGAIYNLKNDENFYCYNAGESKDILQNTIEISNFIYQRKTLPEEYFTFDKKKKTVTVNDVGLPLSQLIFCVNGADGNISTNISGSEIMTEAKIEAPKFYPEVFSERQLKFGTNLERKIYRYNFSELLQPGEISVNISGGDSVSVIYKADVDIELRLYRNGSIMNENESISTGKYTYRIFIINPVTKTAVTSPLLDGAVYSVKTENQSNIANLNEKEGEISFLKGNTRVETTVDLGTQKFKKSEGFYVFGDADFIIKKMYKYKVNALNGCMPFRIAVKTESLPENVRLYCTSKENIDFYVERSEVANEFLVYPTYKNKNTYVFTPAGDLDVVFTIEINENGEVLTYSKSGIVTIEDVPFFRRAADWIWYYKWFFAVVFAAVALFLALFNVYLKKKKNIYDGEAEKNEENADGIDKAAEIGEDDNFSKTEETRENMNNDGE